MDIEVVHDGHGRSFPAGTSVVIGRGVDCDVVLRDTRVSRRHLELRYDRGWQVRNLSGNGTWFGGERVDVLPVGQALAVRLGHPDDGPLLELNTRLGLEDPLEPVALRHGLTIGRDTGNDVVLTDLLVSRQHARLVATGRDYVVEDLGSANRTFVNGSAIGSSVLREGDQLTIGRTRLVSVGGWLCPSTAENSADGLVVDELRYRLPSGRALTSGVSFEVHGASLLAVIGPSGSGKSTLLRLLSGELTPDSGQARYQDADVGLNAEIRTRIGVIPQHTVAHHRLTVRQALDFTAELRLPEDLPAQDRARRVQEVMDELGLAEHADTRADRLSGGQLRRLSIGFELLTRPSLLLVDEPTAGLDPALVRQVMRLLRELADGGRQIVVTTHDLAYLELCDNVLVLAPGGHAVYNGPPAGIEQRFGTGEWADIFEGLAAAPLTEDTPVPAGRPASRAAPDPISRSRLLHQTGVLVRRQLRLLAADATYALFLALLPVVLAIFALAVPGETGLGTPAKPGDPAAMRLLVVLLIGAAFMGMAVPVRDLVGERGIYRHERAAGLLPESYLVAKLVVFTLIALAQSAILVAVVRALRPGPADAILPFLPPTLELTVAVALTAIACVTLGLACSALVSSAEQATPPLVVGVMAQLVLCGGLIPVHGQRGLEQLSWLMPARWGYAAAAATASLKTSQDDPLWGHSAGNWLLSASVLIMLGGAGSLAAYRAVRR